MDPIIVGAAAAGAATLAIVGVAKRQSKRTRSGTTKRLKPTEGGPKRAWLVTFVNSAGVTTNNADLSGVTAELAGRATGWAGRRSKAKWTRRWTTVHTAAQRSRAAREKRWQDAGRPPLLVQRKPKQAAAAAAKPASPPAATAPPAPGPEPPKRHLKPVPDLPNPSGAAVTATQDQPAPSTKADPEAPPDWTLMADRVRNFAPEDDTALIAFMRGESIGVLAYAAALEQARENCVNDVGLDPNAVAGFTTYSEHVSEAAERMSEAYQTFVAVYGEVQQLAASGVVMPYKGRFFTGAAG